LSINSADDDVYGMETMIVILFSILIAQLSKTYIQAMKVDRLEYDVDRLFQLTRICTERFLFWYKLMFKVAGSFILQIKDIEDVELANALRELQIQIDQKSQSEERKISQGANENP
ncbi:hypothetical protein pdam_00022810, partial [Pocillopora damicornis]